MESPYCLVLIKAETVNYQKNNEVIMQARDFSGEGYYSLIYRVGYAICLRIRGLLFSFIFRKRARHLTIGCHPIFVNPGGVLLGNCVHFGRMLRLETYQKDDIDNSPRVCIGDN